jgi:hypothetical protein
MQAQPGPFFLSPRPEVPRTGFRQGEIQGTEPEKAESPNAVGGHFKKIEKNLAEIFSSKYVLRQCIFDVFLGIFNLSFWGLGGEF